jgi:hypothetical protein
VGRELSKQIASSISTALSPYCMQYRKAPVPDSGAKLIMECFVESDRTTSVPNREIVCVADQCRSLAIQEALQKSPDRHDRFQHCASTSESY